MGAHRLPDRLLLHFASRTRTASAMGENPGSSASDGTTSGTPYRPNACQVDERLSFLVQRPVERRSQGTEGWDAQGDKLWVRVGTNTFGHPDFEWRDLPTYMLHEHESRAAEFVLDQRARSRASSARRSPSRAGASRSGPGLRGRSRERCDWSITPLAKQPFHRWRTGDQAMLASEPVTIAGFIDHRGPRPLDELRVELADGEERTVQRTELTSVFDVIQGHYDVRARSTSLAAGSTRASRWPSPGTHRTASAGETAAREPHSSPSRSCSGRPTARLRSRTTGVQMGRHRETPARGLLPAPRQGPRLARIESRSLTPPSSDARIPFARCSRSTSKGSTLPFHEPSCHLAERGMILSRDLGRATDLELPRSFAKRLIEDEPEGPPSTCRHQPRRRRRTAAQGRNPRDAASACRSIISKTSPGRAIGGEDGIDDLRGGNPFDLDRALQMPRPRKVEGQLHAEPRLRG